MFYREAGQFKASYAEDARIFPIRQDRIGFWVLMLVLGVAVPLFSNEYWLKAILIPVLIFSLAALGLNILTGYAGQLSLGSAAFMAVGAFATYGFLLRVPGLPLPLATAATPVRFSSEVCDGNNPQGTRPGGPGGSDRHRHVHGPGVHVGSVLDARDRKPWHGRGDISCGGPPRRGDTRQQALPLLRGAVADRGQLRGDDRPDVGSG